MNDPAGHGHTGMVREDVGQLCTASNASAVTSGPQGLHRGSERQMNVLGSATL